MGIEELMKESAYLTGLFTNVDTPYSVECSRHWISTAPPEQVNPDGSKADQRSPKKGYTLRPSQTIQGLLVIQLLADGTMKVEKLPGVTDPKMFTGFSDKALIYVR